MTDNPLTNAAIILILVLMAWYFVGSQMNRRRATALLRLLRPGLEDLGAKFEVRSLGTAGVRVIVGEPRAPFSRVRVHLSLVAREIIFLWLYHRLRGRRDHFIVEADLATRPETELLLADPATPLGRLAVDRAGDRGQDLRPVSGRGGSALLRWGRTPAAEKLAADFARNGAPPGMPIWLVAVQMKSPQMLAMYGLETVDPDAVRLIVRRVRDLARDVTREERKGRRAESGRGSRNGRPAAEPGVDGDEGEGLSAP